MPENPTRSNRSRSSPSPGGGTKRPRRVRIGEGAPTDRFEEPVVEIDVDDGHPDGGRSTPEELRPTAASGISGELAPAAPLCSFALCPICMALTVMGEARPDLIQHVLLASREVLLALRAVIDARLEGTKGAPPKLERLEIG
jgi:hypothetical protein